MTVLIVFQRCVEAIQRGDLIKRGTKQDKEFAFQNWFRKRLDSTKHKYKPGSRNRFPDFQMVKKTDSYELKSLAHPGRKPDFDSNSQIPTGLHNGQNIYYVFGRYPKKHDRNKYPVIDLVICHGDFLNADHDYVHKNDHVEGFGSYGDLMIRDRKMYVVPSPFHLVEGTKDHRTLILPATVEAGANFIEVGQLKRIEAKDLIVGYTFNLKTNGLISWKEPNPKAGNEHPFRAWRLKGDSVDTVSMR